MPSAAERRYHLGMIYVDNNDHDQAIEELQTVLESGQNINSIEQSKLKLDEITK